MIINIRLYHVISILSCIYSQPIIVCIYATPVSLLTHLNFYVIFIHNQKIKKGKNKMIKKIKEKINEFKSYEYSWICSCKICKFFRLVKIK